MNRRLNPRQRRGFWLIAVATCAAVGSFVSLSSYVADVRSTVGPLAPVLQLSREVPVNRPVEAAATQVVLVPRRWVPATALDDVADLQGLVATSTLRPGSYLQADMVGPPPSLQPGERSVLLAVEPDSISGEVAAGSRIDVLAALDKQRTGGVSGSRIVVNGALVLGVARAPSIADEDGDDRGTEVRLTLALSTADSQALNWAQSFATKISVSLVAPGSDPVPAKGRELQLKPDTDPSPSPTGGP